MGFLFFYDTFPDRFLTPLLFFLTVKKIESTQNPDGLSAGFFAILYAVFN